MPTISISDVPSPVLKALTNASKNTGADFEYLLKTAQRESNFNPKARARTTTATGLFQFIKSTWLKLIKEEGANFGLKPYADAISREPGGRYKVHNPVAEQKILDLRNEPDVAAVMAGLLAKQNGEHLSRLTGQTPTQGDLYAAHFLGPGDAARLIALNQSAPNDRASSHFASAARHNAGIFMDGPRHKSIAEVYHTLTRQSAGLTEDLKDYASQVSDWSVATIAEPHVRKPFSDRGGQDAAPKSAGSIGVWDSISGPARKYAQEHGLNLPESNRGQNRLTASSPAFGQARLQLPNAGFTFLQGLASDPAKDKN